jgi:uncharacterized membrane protein YdjX (TVP38/TMEM64 family)
MTRRALIVTIAVFLLLLGIIALPAVRERLANGYTLVTDREWVQETVRSFGWAAPLVFIGLQVGQVVAAPVPGEATGIIGGYVFGAGWGFAYSTVALALGSLINFAIGRMLGERFVRRLVSAEAFGRLNRMVTHQGVVAVMIMFIVPGFPKDYLCLLLGLTAMPLKLFALIAALGRMPGTLMLSLQGASLYERNYWMLGLLFAVCALAVFLAWRFRERLYLWVEKMNNRPAPPRDGPDDGRLSP